MATFVQGNGQVHRWLAFCRYGLPFSTLKLSILLKVTVALMHSVTLPFRDGIVFYGWSTDMEYLALGFGRKTNAAGV
jgi:hypothetical protein